MKILYKEKIASDVQDIYRELENYSSIIDSRILRLKTLTERHESALKTWENIQKDLKKSKTGKEILNYIEEQELKPAIKPEDIALMKKEITDDIKAFIAKKLNLTQDVAPKVQKMALNMENPVEKTKPAIDDANIAELIIQEMDQETVIRRPKPIQIETTQPPVSFKKTLVDEKKSNNTSNGFLNILGSVGKVLSPLFLKSESSIPENNFSTKRALPEKSFNDLIKKEMRSPASRPEPSVIFEPVKSVSPAQKTMEPEELVRLLEELKNSRLRPIALKNLLTHGFQLNQIADISNIPISDLELTKNLYNIQPERITQ